MSSNSVRLPAAPGAAGRRTSYASVAARASTNDESAEDLYRYLQTSRTSRNLDLGLFETEVEEEDGASPALGPSWIWGTDDGARSTGESGRSLREAREMQRLLRRRTFGYNRSGSRDRDSVGSCSDDEDHSSRTFLLPTYLRGSKYARHILNVVVDDNTKQTMFRVSRRARSMSSSSMSSGSSCSHVGDETPSTPLPQPLPRKWSSRDCHKNITVTPDGLQADFKGGSRLGDHEAVAVRSNHPIPPRIGIYYYEVFVESKGKDGMIGVGFSGRRASLDKLPGWELESWAYHGDDGKSFCCQSTGRPYGPTFTNGDTIGCGIDFVKRTAFFTRNGSFLGTAFRDINPVSALYPSIGMKRPHAHLITNFGSEPFVFDIVSLVQEHRKGIGREIEATPTQCLDAALTLGDLSKAIVAQFLVHEGHVGTAHEFTAEIKQEKEHLDSHALDAYMVSETDLRGVHRQEIRTAILGGNIDQAIVLLKTHFPQVLDKNREAVFELKCQQYVEMMQTSTQLFTTLTSSNDMFNGAGESVHAVKEDALNRILEHGRSLQHEVAQGSNPRLRKSMQERLDTLFGMLAYTNVRQSPAARLLEPRLRNDIAEMIGRAILAASGKPPHTALERLYRQTVVLTDLLSEDGGPGAHVNIPRLMPEPDAHDV